MKTENFERYSQMLNYTQHIFNGMRFATERKTAEPITGIWLEESPRNSHPTWTTLSCCLTHTIISQTTSLFLKRRFSTSEMEWPLTSDN